MTLLILQFCLLASLMLTLFAGWMRCIHSEPRPRVWVYRVPLIGPHLSRVFSHGWIVAALVFTLALVSYVLAGLIQRRADTRQDEIAQHIQNLNEVAKRLEVSTAKSEELAKAARHVDQTLEKLKQLEGIADVNAKLSADSLSQLKESVARVDTVRHFMLDLDYERMWRTELDRHIKLHRDNLNGVIEETKKDCEKIRSFLNSPEFAFSSLGNAILPDKFLDRNLHNDFCAEVTRLIVCTRKVTKGLANDQIDIGGIPNELTELWDELVNEKSPVKNWKAELDKLERANDAVKEKYAFALGSVELELDYWKLRSIETSNPEFVNHWRQTYSEFWNARKYDINKVTVTYSGLYSMRQILNGELDKFEDAQRLKDQQRLMGLPSPTTQPYPPGRFPVMPAQSSQRN